VQRFPIRFTGLNHTMALVGMVPSRCSVDLIDEPAGARIHVRMGMWFDLEAPLDTVQSAEPDTDRVLGWGVHGWRDQWLVNGSSQGLVRIIFAPTQRAWMGAVPLRVRVLRVSLDDPDGLVAALARPATA
jgi:hypothetical protein